MPRTTLPAPHAPSAPPRLADFGVLVALGALGALAACASPSGPPADRIVYRTDEAPAPALGAALDRARDGSRDELRDAVRTEGPTPAETARGPLPRVAEMTDAERMAWFRGHGVYPYPLSPASDGQNLGYVHRPADWSWIGPTVITSGVLYGLYRLKRHHDWW